MEHIIDPSMWKKGFNGQLWYQSPQGTDFQCSIAGTISRSILTWLIAKLEQQKSALKEGWMLLNYQKFLHWQGPSGKSWARKRTRLDSSHSLKVGNSLQNLIVTIPVQYSVLWRNCCKDFTSSTWRLFLIMCKTYHHVKQIKLFNIMCLMNPCCLFPK